MSDAETAIIQVLHWEVDPERGPFCDVPDDAGGPTCWGITIPTYSQYLNKPATRDDVRLVSLDSAIVFYKWLWMKKPFAFLAAQVVATKTFDAYVNCEPGEDILILQRALCDVGHEVTVDGELGPHTLAAANGTDWRKLVDAMCARQLAYYQKIVLRDPTQQKFLTAPGGWGERASWRG